MPNSAQFCLRIAILTGQIAKQGQSLSSEGKLGPSGGPVRAGQTFPHRLCIARPATIDGIRCQRFPTARTSALAPALSTPGTLVGGGSPGPVTPRGDTQPRSGCDSLPAPPQPSLHHPRARGGWAKRRLVASALPFLAGPLDCPLHWSPRTRVPLGLGKWHPRPVAHDFAHTLEG